MNTLTDLYNQQIVPMDEVLEKQAGEMVKQAEEEEFAGRIMARGFADELNKIAQDIKPMPKGETIKAQAPALKYGPGAQKSQGGMPGRTSAAPGGGMKMAPMNIAKTPKPGVASPFSSPKPAAPAAAKPPRLAGGPR